MRGEVAIPNAVHNAIAAPITTHYFLAHTSEVNVHTETHYKLMLVNTLQKLNSNPGDIPHSKIHKVPTQDISYILLLNVAGYMRIYC